MSAAGARAKQRAGRVNAVIRGGSTQHLVITALLLLLPVILLLLILSLLVSGLYRHFIASPSVGEESIVMSVSVCLSPEIHVTYIFSKLLCMLPKVMACVSSGSSRPTIR